MSNDPIQVRANAPTPLQPQTLARGALTFVAAPDVK
jgi:hypothetical protein